MRRVDLSAELPASAEEAWALFTDTGSWPRWSHLVTSAAGRLEPGCRWTMQLRPQGNGKPRQMRPHLVSVDPPRELAFETRIAGLVHILHRFVIEPRGAGRSALLQHFEISGLGVALLWGPVRRGVLQFDELGHDLARRLRDGDVAPG